MSLESFIDKVNIFKFQAEEFSVGLCHEMPLAMRDYACQHEARLVNNSDSITHQISELANFNFLLQLLFLPSI